MYASSQRHTIRSHIHPTISTPTTKTIGTCLPLCLAGYALRFLGIQHVKIVFVESFCRVQSLSVTGRLLYFLADRFVVQWPGLVERCVYVAVFGVGIFFSWHLAC